MGLVDASVRPSDGFQPSCWVDTRATGMRPTELHLTAAGSCSQPRPQGTAAGHHSPTTAALPRGTEWAQPGGSPTTALHRGSHPTSGILPPNTVASPPRPCPTPGIPPGTRPCVTHHGDRASRQGTAPQAPQPAAELGPAGRQGGGVGGREAEAAGEGGRGDRGSGAGEEPPRPGHGAYAGPAGRPALCACAAPYDTPTHPPGPPPRMRPALLTPAGARPRSAVRRDAPPLPPPSPRASANRRPRFPCVLASHGGGI